MQRLVQPEILDSLSPEDPAAVASRRDIRLYNWLMGNFRWIRQTLGAHGTGGPAIELGAGDGSLGFYLLRHGILKEAVPYTGMDLMQRPVDWPAGWGWLQQDIREAIPGNDCRILIANLILHHFEPADLHRIGAGIRQSSLQFLLFNEPKRTRLPLLLVGLSRLLGMHPVTLHDARVSIRAGFRQRELPDFLGLGPSGWKIRATESRLGANRIICERR